MRVLVNECGKANPAGAGSCAVSLIEAELVALEQADLDIKAFLKRLRAEPGLKGRRARQGGRSANGASLRDVWAQAGMLASTRAFLPVSHLRDRAETTPWLNEKMRGFLLLFATRDAGVRYGSSQRFAAAQLR